MDWSHLVYLLLQERKKKGLEVTGTRGRRRKQILNDLETRGYYRSKEKALYHILTRTGFERSYGPVIRHYRMNE